jgi:hypothetical protein
MVMRVRRPGGGGGEERTNWALKCIFLIIFNTDDFNLKNVQPNHLQNSQSIVVFSHALNPTPPLSAVRRHRSGQRTSTAAAPAWPG